MSDKQREVWYHTAVLVESHNCVSILWSKFCWHKIEVKTSEILGTISYTDGKLVCGQEVRFWFSYSRVFVSVL